MGHFQADHCAKAFVGFLPETGNFELGHNRFGNGVDDPTIAAFARHDAPVRRQSRSCGEAVPDSVLC
jgi:hypothetical protein